jgi:dGTP triphosphohydrolase
MKNSLNFKDFQGALSHLAFNSSASLGRRFKDDEELSFYGSSHDPFQLDIEKIRLGKFYKRLFNKTQVFSSNINMNVRNRQTHTNEVVSIVSFLDNW